MDEITIGDKKYVSSKRAATITGYAKDYVGQLCREGRVEARLVGRNWYVLESAIREHRFGADTAERPVEEVPEEVTSPASSASDWEKPRYVAETAAYVPEFVAKESVEAPSAPVIADMQSAWKEWFEEKRPQSAVTSAFEAPAEPYVAPEKRVEEFQETQEPVSVMRVAEEREPEVQIAGEIEEDGAVSLHRSYDSRQTGERIPATSVPIVDLSRETRVKKREQARDDVAKGEWNGVVRALCFVLAVLAILIAIVGTGNGDRIFSGTSLNFGAQKALIDYLGGTSTYENSL